MTNLILSTLLVISITMLPIASHASDPVQKGEQATHRVPTTYTQSVRTLKSVKHELNELSESFRLYKFHEPLELFDAIISQLSTKAENDIYDPMRKEIQVIISDLNRISINLDSFADKGDAKQFSNNLVKLEGTIERLDKYIPISNEVKVKVEHNVPPTYKRIVHRMRGVYNALNDISDKGYLYKAHEDIEHIEDAANTINQIFEANVIASLKTKLDHNLSIIREFSHSMHEAGDAEDRDAALHAITKQVSNAIHELEKLGESSHSVQWTLDKADSLFRQRKLTKPVGGNAYELYRKILNADPSNKRAVAGIQNIIKWYLHRIEEFVEKEDWNKASIYSKRVLSISPENQKAKEFYTTAQANHHH